MPVEIAKKKEYEQAVEKDFRYNIFPIVMFEFLWGTGLPFTLSGVLIPSYLNFLAAPKFVIGIVASLAILLTPIQLIGSRYLRGVNRKKKVWVSYLISCFGYIVYGIIGLVIPIEHRIFHMISFTIAIILFFGFIFLAQPVYYNILIDNSPLKKRGRLLGYRTAGMAIGGILMAYPAKCFYESVNPPHSYHIAMIISGICFIFSTISVLFIRDHIDPIRLTEYSNPENKPLWLEIYIILRRLWKTPNYRIFIFFIVTISSSASLAPFLVTYTQDVFGASNDIARIFNLCFLAGLLFGGFLIGLIGDKWGYKLSLSILALLLVLGFGIAICTNNINGVFIAYMLYCITLTISTVICNMSVELLPRANPAHLVAAAQMFILPAAIIVPATCGRIIDIYKATGLADVGYVIVFTVAIVLAIVGAVGTAILVQEPRTGKIYVIKYLRRL